MNFSASFETTQNIMTSTPNMKKLTYAIWPLCKKRVRVTHFYVAFVKTRLRRFSKKDSVNFFKSLKVTKNRHRIYLFVNSHGLHEHKI